MPSRDDILWFKQQFQAQIIPKVAGTPFTVNTLAAIACQETGYLWRELRKPEHNLRLARILELCVGDTLDADRGRRAFPKTKADLLAHPRGDEMFAKAHAALVDMARYIKRYEAVSRRANKFCHGFGIFQFDLQFFKVDPEFFLDAANGYANFDVCCDRAVAELKSKLKKLGWEDKSSLSDHEMAAVAIAYNTGNYKPEKGLKQGHKSDDGRYYGENFLDYYRLSKAVAMPGETAELQAPASGGSILAPPTIPTATGQVFEVDNPGGMLNLRSEPGNTENTLNVIGHLPDGHRVRAITGTRVRNFLEVETSLQGARLRGFASARYLIPAPAGANLITDVTAPSGAVPVQIPAAHLAPPAGAITRRRNAANAYSLNEAGQPIRAGATPQELRDDLAAIVAWLAVDKPSHARYQPTASATFCNIYAHDYCHLAGVYLPRVWWNGPALVKLARGEAVAPRYGVSVDDVRANDLFRWLRDFGPDLGWRRTGTLDKLQQEVNLGAIGLIVARRKEDGRSGHIVAVVPESADNGSAKRDATGAVIAPLQSQAGATNFEYGTGKLNWWLDEKFAESAYWLHA